MGKKQAKDLSELSSRLYDSLKELEKRLDDAQLPESIQQKAYAFKDAVIPAMQKVRLYADGCEALTAEDLWPYPTYSKLLFYV